MSTLNAIGTSRYRPYERSRAAWSMLRSCPTVLGIVVMASAAMGLAGCDVQGEQVDAEHAAVAEGNGDLDSRSIQEMWISYRRALMARDSENALRMVSNASLQYYAGLRNLALTATRSELLAKPIIDRATVLSMRASLSAKALRAAADEEVFGLIVRKALIDGDSIKESTIVGVHVAGAVASGGLVLGGRETGISLTFKYEGGRWTVDLPSLFTTMESTFQQTTLGGGISEKEYAEFLAVDRLGQDRGKMEKAYQPLTR